MPYSVGSLSQVNGWNGKMRSSIVTRFNIKNANLSSNHQGVFNHARLIDRKLSLTDSIL